MDNSGDHTLNGRSWPCLRIDLGITGDHTDPGSSPQFFDSSNCFIDNIQPSPVNNAQWQDVNFDVEVAEDVQPYFEDRYSESGDYFYDRLDEISHIAVIDTTEEESRGFQDFADEYDLGDQVEDAERVDQVESLSSFEEQDGWYQDPYGDDFINDINFMEDFWRPDWPLLRWAMAEGWNQKLEDGWIAALKKRKMKRLNAINVIRSVQQMSKVEQENHETILLIIETLKSRGQANDGVRLLHEFLLCKPTMDLKPYLEEFDFYLKRYVVWGLNYHYNQDKLNNKAIASTSNSIVGSSAASTDEQEYDATMKKLSIRMLQGSQDVIEVSQPYWDLVLEWFTDPYDDNMGRKDQSTNN